MTDWYCDIARVAARFSSHWFSAALSCLLLTAGCDGGPAVYDVAGRVTYQGEAVDSGTINFRSDDGKLYGGGLQANGQYEYRLPQGEYAVRIDAPTPLPSGWKEGDPLPTDARRLAPLKYASFRSSGLTALVSADANSHSIDFELK